jgi:hypothetical protein
MPFFTNGNFAAIWFQINPLEIPIKTKSRVQTGAKTQLGGLKLGFIIMGYHVSILACVTLLDK